MSIAATSLLNAYDPANPSSLDSALTGAGISDASFTLGLNGTSGYDPGTQAPTSGALDAGTAPSAASGENVYQQSLASLQQWTAQTLISSALFGGAGSSGGADSALASVLTSAAAAQQSTLASQQQAALAAAQSAMNAGTSIDASA